MQLLLRERPILEMNDDGTYRILAFDLLPFGLRKEQITLADFIEWASNRTLSIGRSYAKEILNGLRLPQSNRYAICKACRGLSLEDCYWIRQEGDEKTWAEVNLFHNPLSLFVTELSLSGRSMAYSADLRIRGRDPGQIHTPELTTLGASAKGWIRQEDGLYLHKVGKYEIPAGEILEDIGITHISYQVSSEEQVRGYLSEERRRWIEGVGESVVNSRLFTSEERSMVTFEEFKIFCEAYGLNPYEEAVRIDPTAYWQMQVADYILNNTDRHEQNWGFYMENASGRITGYCPLFDHDHAFDSNPEAWSQTTEEPMTLFEAACEAQEKLGLHLDALEHRQCPRFLTEQQWNDVLKRKRRLEGE